MVKYNYEVVIAFARVVETLVCKSARKGSVADNGYRVVLVPVKAHCLRHSQSRRNGRAAVTAYKSVVLRFLGTAKARYTVFFPQSTEIAIPSCQQLVGISLMTHVPYDLIRRRTEHPMDSNGKLHRSKV